MERWRLYRGVSAASLIARPCYLARPLLLLPLPAAYPRLSSLLSPERRRHAEARSYRRDIGERVGERGRHTGEVRAKRARYVYAPLLPLPSLGCSLFEVFLPFFLSSRVRQQRNLAWNPRERYLVDRVWMVEKKRLEERFSRFFLFLEIP